MTAEGDATAVPGFGPARRECPCGPPASPRPPFTKNRVDTPPARSTGWSSRSIPTLILPLCSRTNCRLRLARCAERADAVEFGAESVLLGLQVIAGLQVQPEPLGSAEVPGQPQRGVRGDPALAVHDLVNPPGRDNDRLGQLILAHTQRLEELLEQNLPRVHRRHDRIVCHWLLLSSQRSP